MEEIGRFYIVTFRNKQYEFIVYDEFMICKDLADFEIQRIFIKPNLELRGERGMFLLNDYRTIEKDYIREYNIDDDLFKYMINRHLIRMSTEMAILYSLDREHGFDRKNKTNTFKWARKKGLILEKQKQCIYN